MRSYAIRGFPVATPSCATACGRSDLERTSHRCSDSKPLPECRDKWIIPPTTSPSPPRELAAYMPSATSCPIPGASMCASSRPRTLPPPSGNTFGPDVTEIARHDLYPAGHDLPEHSPGLHAAPSQFDHGGLERRGKESHPSGPGAKSLRPWISCPLSHLRRVALRSDRFARRQNSS